MVKAYSDSEGGNPLPTLKGLLFLISSIPQIGCELCCVSYAVQWHTPLTQHSTLGQNVQSWLHKSSCHLLKHTTALVNGLLNITYCFITLKYFRLRCNKKLKMY